MLIIAFYTLSGIMGLTSFSLAEFFDIQGEVIELFICESTGSQEECGLSANIVHIMRVQAVSIAMIFLSSVVTFPFILDPKACRKTPPPPPNFL